jgi:hypothetical protein
MDLTFLMGLIYSPFTYMMLLVGAIGVWTYRLRAFASPASWAAAALFFLLFIASNSWRFVPMPAETGVFETDSEALRLWVAQANAVRQLGLLIVLALSLGLCTYMAMGFRDPAPTMTRLWLWTDFVAQAGEVVEYTRCKVTSEWLGLEHVAIMDGLDRGGCSRELGWWGMYAYTLPALIPLLIVLYRTYKKSR